MSQSDMTPDQMRARIDRLDAEIKLSERLDRLEARAKAGPGLGSPAAMPVREPASRYLISPHSSDTPSWMDEIRAHQARTVGFDPM